MKSLISILLFGSLIYSPPTVRADDLDQLLSRLIIGSWEEGNVPYGIVTFTADGSYQAKMFSTNNQDNLLLNLSGTWSIKDSELHSLLEKSSSPKAPVGESFVDKIVQINQTELVLIGIDGQHYSKFRVTPRKTK